MQDEALELATESMNEAIERLRTSMSRVRAGRANPAVLDGVRVDSYGASVPLNQVATVSVADARLLVVKPYDRNSLQAIEKAIGSAGLGLNPSSDGVVLRLPIPPLTEERRRALVKQIKELAEDAKVACRQARREANELLKESEKKKELSEDALKKALEKVQEATDRYIKSVDEIFAKKEAEIMDV